MKYNDPELGQKVNFSHNAQLFIDENHLNPDSITNIVIDPNNVIARSRSSHVTVAEGEAVAEGEVGAQTVRVVVSESDIAGGAEDSPLVLNIYGLE